MDTLPAFALNDETLNVLYDSLDYCITGWDGDLPITSGEFSLEQVLDLLSGYDPCSAVPVLDECGEVVPDMVTAPGPLYHSTDLIRALIDEVRRLRLEAS